MSYAERFRAPLLVGSALIFLFNYLFHEIDSVSFWRGLASHFKIIFEKKMNSKEFRRKWPLPNFNYIRVFSEADLAWTKYVEDVDTQILSSVCSACI